MARIPPEHHAQTRRRRKGKKRGGRRHRRKGKDPAARDGWGERAAGFRGDDSEKKVVPASSSPVKKPTQLPSQIGEVFGSLCRVDSIDIEDEVAVVTDFAAMGPTPSPTPAAPDGNSDEGMGVIVAPEAAAAPAPGGAGITAPSSPPPVTASTTPVATSLPAPPPPSCSSPHQVPILHDKKPLLFTASMLPPVAPPSTHQPPASSSHVTAPPLQLLPPLAQQPADKFERHKLLKKRFAGLITKSEKALDDNNYRENLKRGRVAPAPEPEPKPKPKADVNQKTRRRQAAIDAARKRFGMWLRRTEMKAKRDGLFMQNARREHVRALGIDAAMERVVSPERPRDGDGEPVISPGHPLSPVEKLGLFLKL